MQSTEFPTILPTANLYVQSAVDSRDEVCIAFVHIYMMIGGILSLCCCLIFLIMKRKRKRPDYDDYDLTETVDYEITETLAVGEI